MPFDLFHTYLATIKNSVGSGMFRESFLSAPHGEQKDILRNGELSCAFFVSSILKIYDLIDHQHATVSGTIADLEKNGWTIISEPRIGSILVWEKLFSENEWHSHIGFSVGDELAVSNSMELRSPQLHHYTYGKEQQRKITHIFWKEGLDRT